MHGALRGIARLDARQEADHSFVGAKQARVDRGTPRFNMSLFSNLQALYAKDPLGVTYAALLSASCLETNFLHDLILSAVWWPCTLNPALVSRRMPHARPVRLSPSRFRRFIGCGVGLRNPFSRRCRPRRQDRYAMVLPRFLTCLCCVGQVDLILGLSPRTALVALSIPRNSRQWSDDPCYGLAFLEEPKGVFPAK
jgi:hypothetical protein